jgi:hypothetical protein
MEKKNQSRTTGLTQSEDQSLRNKADKNVRSDSRFKSIQYVWVGGVDRYHTINTYIKMSLP